MARESFSLFLRRLTRGMAAETLRDHPDHDLVARALAGRDEAAYRAIVCRHGAMVYRVCLRTLAQPEDAEDAFQATFLVLARSLQTLRKRASLASWLHGVAHRVALKARAQAASRRRRERQVTVPSDRPREDETWADLRAALDRELVRLPERWRQPLVLCYLEGRTQDEAAAHLGWSKSTLRRRLPEARAALAARLRRHDITLSGALAAVLISDCQTSAAPTSGLVASTVEVAVRFAAGNTIATLVPPRVAILTEGVLSTMVPSKLTWGVPLLHSVGVVAVGMAWMAAPSGQAQQPPAADKEKAPAQAPAPADPNRPWRAFGRVTDRDGKPLAGVQVAASCGIGSLRHTGNATTGDDGRYEMDFGPGVLMSGGNGHQAATISVHKSGFFETNLSRQGHCTAANAMPSGEQMKSWNVAKDRVFLPGRPIELNFVMQPAGRVSGKLVDEQGRPLAKYSVALAGADLPPSSGVLRSVYADDQGRFTLEDIPTTYRYQFEVRKAEVKPPWDDSWASAALRFGKPDQGDLRAWFGDREIRVKDFVLRVTGPGVHGRTATATAGNAGLLNLTAAPADVVERRDTLLSTASATLTLRNTSTADAAPSLVPEPVPAAAASPTKTRLARTRPDAAGAFVVSFENPRGVALEKGKHQAVFQLVVGASQRPVRDKVLRQLDIREGRYEVALTVAPNLVADSQVTVTFVTIQPDHDAWVKAFFQEGKGPGYKGLWVEDRATLPTIPFAAAGK